jgi:hypothetical protein
MLFTADHPIIPHRFKTTRTLVPQMHLNRPTDIIRKPVKGPKDPKKPTTQLNMKFTITITATESQNPRPNTGPSDPVANVAGLWISHRPW